MNCSNHAVALYGDRHIYANEIVEHVKSEAYGWSEHAKIRHFLAIKKGELKEYKPIEFLDRRRGFMNMYNYCPVCGVKIDWEKIKREVRALEGKQHDQQR